jgi:hypothetical protein
VSANFDFLGRELRQDLTTAELARIEEPCVVFERYALDSDKVMHWIYTVGGFLDGKRVGSAKGGALVGGQAIIVHASTRQDADMMAGLGLETTIESLQKGVIDALDGTGVTSHGQVLSTRH